MRYTEARLTEVAALLLQGIDEDAVDFRPTYDGEATEPIVLPAAFPNLLANGAQGIAVGVSGLYAMSYISSANDDVLSRQVPASDCASTAELAVTRAHDAAAGSANVTDLEELAGHEERIEDDLALLQACLAAVKMGTVDDKGVRNERFDLAGVDGGPSEGRSLRSVWQTHMANRPVMLPPSNIIALAGKADLTRVTYAGAVRAAVAAARERIRSSAALTDSLRDLEGETHELARTSMSVTAEL